MKVSVISRTSGSKRCNKCDYKIDFLKDSYSYNKINNKHYCFKCDPEIATEGTKILPFMQKCNCGTSGYSEDPKYKNEQWKCFTCRKREV